MALLGGVYSALTVAYLGGIAVFSGAIGRAIEGYGDYVETAAGVALVALGAGLAAEGVAESLRGGA